MNIESRVQDVVVRIPLRLLVPGWRNFYYIYMPRPKKIGEYKKKEIRERTCFKCKKVYLLNASNFRRNKNSPKGLSYHCRFCKKSELEIEQNRIAQRQRNLKLRFSVLQRDSFTCQYCGRKSPDVILEIDHIIPKSKGGKNKKENYQTACKDCNIGKGDGILDEFK